MFNQFINLKRNLVFDIIKKVEELSGKNAKYKIKDRRPGDPPYLVADITLAKELLDWVPQSSDIENIISSAFDWYQLNA